MSQEELPIGYPKEMNLNDLDQLKKFVFDYLNTFIDIEESYTFTVFYDVLQERLKICEGCEFFNKEKLKCKSCGCPILKKANQTFETCPMDKWGPDEQSFNEQYFGYILSQISSEHFAIELKDGTESN
jgi:hypothetical protein